MIVEVTSYKIKCDRCQTEFYDGEFNIFEDEGMAVESAIDSFNWAENSEVGSLYCPKCTWCEVCNDTTAMWEEEFGKILCSDCYDEHLQREEEAEDEADEATTKMGDGN